MSRKIEDLEDYVIPRAVEFLRLLDERECRYVILETRRSKERQQALYAQGRESYEEVCRLRNIAGLGGISREDAATIVTWTLKSKHIDGLALDVAPVKPNGDIPWNIKDASTAALWMEIGELGEKAGFSWGGRWKPLDNWNLGRDLPHFEMPPK